VIPRSTWLVTGGAGFIGSHLVERLLARGNEVLVLDDLSTGRRANLAAAEGSPRLEFHEGSVTDAAAVEALAARADRVVHLAAVVGVRLVVEEPLRTLDVNVRGTDVVLAACARRGTPVFVASSSEVYGRGVRLPFHEDDDLLVGATSKSRGGYAAGKATAECLALAHFRESGLPVRVGRFFNTVGPRQRGRYGMVVPRFVRQALAGGPIVVHGDGSQTRAFAHVAEVVESVLRVMETQASVGRVLNVGGDEETTIRRLAERVRDLVDPAVAIEHVSHASVYGADFEDLPRRVPDTSRLRETIGFAPSMPLDAILADVVTHARAEAALVG
jgi:UDP-glucose 4-epimerase